MTILSIFLGICLAFVPFICAKWSVPFRRKLFYRLIRNIDMTNVTHVMVKYSDQTWEIISTINVNPTKDTFFEEFPTKGFRARKLMYVFNSGD